MILLTLNKFASWSVEILNIMLKAVHPQINLKKRSVFTNVLKTIESDTHLYSLTISLYMSP